MTNKPGQPWLSITDPIKRVVGVGDALTARIAERAGADAIWASGLAISLGHGVPDAGLLTMSEMLNAARFIDRATDLPTICDCDTGFGGPGNVLRTLREYEAAGIAAVCLEDKIFPKRNSFASNKHHQLAEAAEFAAQIHRAKESQTNSTFGIFARTEALVIGEPMQEACRRSLMYADAGADVVLIHSKAREASEVIEFASRFREVNTTTPLACVPTTYPTTTAQEFHDAGFSVVIWANQATRSSVIAMERAVAQMIQHDSTESLEDDISSVKELFDLSGQPAFDLDAAAIDTYKRLQT